MKWQKEMTENNEMTKRNDKKKWQKIMKWQKEMTKRNDRK